MQLIELVLPLPFPPDRENQRTSGDGVCWPEADCVDSWVAAVSGGRSPFRR